MAMEIEVSTTDLVKVLNRVKDKVDQGETEYETGTYEEGVFDCIRWMLGVTSTPPGAE